MAIGCIQFSETSLPVLSEGFGCLERLWLKLRQIRTSQESCKIRLEFTPHDTAVIFIGFMMLGNSFKLERFYNYKIYTLT